MRWVRAFILVGLAGAATACLPIPTTGEIMAYPGNTGVPSNVTLTTYTGPTTISTANTVIDGKQINSCLLITAANVTISNSRVSCDNGSDSDAGIESSETGTGLVVEDVEITTSNPGVTMLRRAMLLRAPATVNQVYAHHMVSGIYFWGHEGTTVTNSFIGDPFQTCSTVHHGSGFGANGGVGDIYLFNNNVAMDQGSNGCANPSSAISFYPEGWAGGGGDGIVIEGNLLGCAGCSADVYLGHTPPEVPHTNMQFIDNCFNAQLPPANYAASWTTGGGNVWSNNWECDIQTEPELEIVATEEVLP
jgi:hypothetical protein